MLITCYQVRIKIDEMINGVSCRNNISQHLEDCESCRTYLKKRKMMLSLLNQFPSHHVDSQAELMTLKESYKIWPFPSHSWAIGSFSALASGFAVVLIFWLTSFGVPEIKKEHLKNQGVIAYLGEVKTINLLFNSQRELDNVRFSLIIPPGINIKEYADTQHLTWQGKLTKGDNILSIPIIAKSLKSQNISLSIEHESSQKLIYLMVDVRKKHGQIIDYSLIIMNT